MATKKELMEMRRKRQNEEKAPAVESTETVLDIIANKEDTLKGAEPDLQTEKKSPSKPAVKSSAKKKSKIVMLGTEKETRSVQKSLYFTPSTYENLEEMLSIIKKEKPNSSIRTINDLVNEIINIFFEED